MGITVNEDKTMYMYVRIGTALPRASVHGSESEGVYLLSALPMIYP